MDAFLEFNCFNATIFFQIKSVNCNENQRSNQSSNQKRRTLVINLTRLKESEMKQMEQSSENNRSSNKCNEQRSNSSFIDMGKDATVRQSRRISELKKNIMNKNENSSARVQLKRKRDSSTDTVSVD